MTAETAPPAAPDAVFLIHGLGGTQYDLGSMHKRLKNAGFVTHSLTLPGHGTQPEDLANVTAEDWIDAVVAKYREVRDAHPTLHLMGMCMGALLAAVLAERERHAKGRLVLLAPPVFIDGWATPWYRELRPLLYAVPGLRKRMKIEEEEPYGIKNEQLRAIVKAKFERGENFHYRWVPLECLRQVDRLRAVVMKAAPKIACPTLVVHAREDELTSLRSANFLVEKIGGGRARMVVLEDSYHMVCVDNDKEIVARNVLEFFGAAMPGATSILANEPRMTADDLAAAVAALTACLERGDFEGVRALGIPDLAWVQPGGRTRTRDADRAARYRDARVAGRTALRMAQRQAARSALVRRRRRARGFVLRSAGSGDERSLRARAIVRDGNRRIADAQGRPGQRRAAGAVFALQAGERRGRDGRASRRARHGGPGEIRRVGQAQGRDARRRDARIRRTGEDAEGTRYREGLSVVAQNTVSSGVKREDDAQRLEQSHRQRARA